MHRVLLTVGSASRGRAAPFRSTSRSPSVRARGRPDRRGRPTTPTPRPLDGAEPRRCLGATTSQKILLIGSGPIVIGQAAEFDYSGVQACKVLREEGYEVVLVNSNPATIMTDPEFADRTYVEPLTARVGRADHRARAPGRAAADARRPDGAQPREGAARRRHPRALRGRADRRRLRRDPPRRGPRGVPRDDGGRRPAGPVVDDRRVGRRGRARRSPTARSTLPAIVRPGVHAGRAGRRRRPRPRPSCARSSPRASRRARSTRCWSRSRCSAGASSSSR